MKRIHRINTVAFLLMFFGLVSCKAEDIAKDIDKETDKEIPVEVKKPNVIVIMADDLGYKDVGFNGCVDIPTPNIDRVADEGVKFTNGYTSYSVCGPSRAGFITGRYEQRFGFERNPQYKPDDPEMGLTKNERTIGEALLGTGYKSGVIGKWHLGSHPSNHPLNRGFDEFYGHLGGGHTYFHDNLTIEDCYSVSTESESYKTWIMRNHTPEKTNKYLTDEFSDEAVGFIEKYKDEPFFLFLSYNAPHGPLEASEKYLTRFPNITDTKRKTYAAMVSAVDDGVGRVLDMLDYLDIDKNTLVFFLSDNGGPETKNASDNGILREGKSSVYEGGFRVPFALRWKGRITPLVYEHPVSSLDIFATLAGLSGISLNPQKPLDGVDLMPYVTGVNNEIPHKNIYLRKFDQGRLAVRDGNFKLVGFNNGSRLELYDLSKDVSESNNIAAQYPEKVNELKRIWDEWDEQLIDPTFLGLIHTEAFQKNMKNKQRRKDNFENR